MHKNRIKDSHMLGVRKRAVLAFSELALMIFFGSLALLGYGLLTSGAGRSYASSLLPSDVKSAFLFSLSFMILSGFFISVIVVINLQRFQLSWSKRAIVNSALLIVHVVIFITLFGNDYSISDTPLVVLGIIVVILSELAVGLLWKGRLGEAAPGA